MWKSITLINSFSITIHWFSLFFGQLLTHADVLEIQNNDDSNMARVSQIWRGLESPILHLFAIFPMYI